MNKKQARLDSGSGYELSEPLAEFMGMKKCYRGDITKKLWVYIKEKVKVLNNNRNCKMKRIKE